MITKFNLIGNEGKPEVGDYVICDEIPQSEPKFLYAEVIDFLKNNVGKIKKYDVDTDYEGEGKYGYIVVYNNIPIGLVSYFMYANGKGRRMLEDDIKYWRKNREDLEMILSSKKYNII